MKTKQKGSRKAYIYRNDLSPNLTAKYGLRVEGLNRFLFEAELVGVVKELIKWMDECNVAERVQILFEPSPEVGTGAMFFWQPLTHEEKQKICRFLNIKIS